MKLISICPSNTEIATYLGLTSNLIAVDDYSDWPKEIQSLPRVGSDLSIDINLIEKLQPDLVLASLSVPGMENNIKKLKERKIPHLILNPNSLDDIAKDIITVGKHTNKLEKAKQVVNQYKHFIQKYEDIARAIQTPKSLYWEWWPKPVFSPGGKNWLTEISSLAGGYNIFKDKQQASIQSDWDIIKSYNPEHICLAWVGVKQEKMSSGLIKKRPGWKEITAVQQNNIHIFEEEFFCRPSPRLLVGLKKLASILHPNHFPEYDQKDPLLL